MCFKISEIDKASGTNCLLMAISENDLAGQVMGIITVIPLGLFFPHIYMSTYSVPAIVIAAVTMVNIIYAVRNNSI